LLKNLLVALDPTLDAYKKVLSEREYLTGDEVTLADLAWPRQLGGGLTSLPAIRRKQ